jgi:hypothetical protein
MPVHKTHVQPCLATCVLVYWCLSAWTKGAYSQQGAVVTAYGMHRDYQGLVLPCAKDRTSCLLPMNCLVLTMIGESVVLTRSETCNHTRQCEMMCCPSSVFCRREASLDATAFLQHRAGRHCIPLGRECHHTGSRDCKVILSNVPQIWGYFGLGIVF